MGPLPETFACIMFTRSAHVPCMYVACPAGSYWSTSIVLNMCKKCPKGTYSAEPNSSNCTACPAGTILSKDRTGCGKPHLTGPAACQACNGSEAEASLVASTYLARTLYLYWAFYCFIYKTTTGSIACPARQLQQDTLLTETLFFCQ